MGQLSIFDGTEQSLLNRSLKLIKSFEKPALHRNPKGFIVGYSGGKDSDVLVHLFRRAGVKFSVVHNHTTLDFPETVYYVRRKFHEWELQGIDCNIYMPNTNFWSLCLQKLMLPSRKVRFCCDNFKERDIPELRFALRSFGVRKAESIKRSVNRDSIETRNRADYKDLKKYHFDNLEDVRQTGACYINNYFFLNPLADWGDDYLWDYIYSEKVEVNPKYADGYERIGCALCPLAKTCQRQREAKDYPKYTQRYIKLADDIIQRRKALKLSNKYNFKTGQEYFDIWMNNEKLYVSEEYDLFNLEEQKNG